MRFIIRNIHDIDGVTEEIISLIDERFGIDYGAVFDFGDPGRKRRDDIEYLSYKYCTSDPVQMDRETLNTSVPRSILDGMLGYKSMALDMVSRETHYNVYRISYLEDFYYEHLQFWYRFLTEKDIDFVLFLAPPHHAGEYILYSLCELLSIRKMFITEVMPGGTYIPACRITELGKYVMENYSKPDDGSVELNDTLKAYIERVNASRSYSPADVKRIKKEVHSVLFSFYNRKKVLKAVRRLFTIPLLPQNKANREYEAWENKRFLSLVYDIRREERRMDHIEDYNKLSVPPDFTQRFIYFPLQQEPEDTTMPRAGEFKNQLLSLLILSKAAGELGLTVYVKEHWVQEHRPKGYYNRINSMENVKLVSIETNSCELILKSVAVASQTGSCIMEAMILDKNPLIFGEGCPYIGMPGSYYVGNETDIINAVTDIEKNGSGFTVEDRDRYLVAYQKSYIDFYCDSLVETKSPYDMKISANRIVDCITKVAGYEAK